MHKLFKLRRIKDSGIAARTIPHMRYPTQMDRVEPLVKAGVIRPPPWLQLAKIVPPIIAAPLRRQKRLKFPTDRLVHIFRKRNPQILQEPLNMTPGAPPTVAYVFACRQLALMQDGCAEDDAYRRVEHAMAREREEKVAAAAAIARRARDEAAGALARAAAGVGSSRAGEGGNGEGGSESGGVAPGDAFGRFSVIEDEEVYQGLLMWKEEIAEKPYPEWDLGPRVALDTFLMRSVFGLTDEDDKHMAEINDGSLERIEHQASLLRCALFPNTAASASASERAIFADMPAWRTAEEIEAAEDNDAAATAAGSAAGESLTANGSDGGGGEAGEGGHRRHERLVRFRQLSRARPDFWSWPRADREALEAWVSAEALLRDNIAIKVADRIDYFAYRDGKQDALPASVLRPFVYEAIADLFPRLQLVDPTYVMRLKRAEVREPGTLRRVWEERRRRRECGDDLDADADGSNAGATADGAAAADGVAAADGGADDAGDGAAEQYDGLPVEVQCDLSPAVKAGWVPDTPPATWPAPPPPDAVWGAGPELDAAVNDYIAEQDKVVRQGVRRRRRQERRAALVGWQARQLPSAEDDAEDEETQRLVAGLVQEATDAGITKADAHRMVARFLQAGAVDGVAEQELQAGLRGLIQESFLDGGGGDDGERDGDNAVRDEADEEEQEENGNGKPSWPPAAEEVAMAAKFQEGGRGGKEAAPLADGGPQPRAAALDDLLRSLLDDAGGSGGGSGGGAAVHDDLLRSLLNGGGGGAGGGGAGAGGAASGDAKDWEALLSQLEEVAKSGKDPKAP